MNRSLQTVRLLSVAVALACAVGCNYSSDKPHVLGQDDGLNSSVAEGSQPGSDSGNEGDSEIIEDNGTTANAGTDGTATGDIGDNGGTVGGTGGGTGGTGGGTGTTDPQIISDTTAPTVISSTPTNAASGVFSAGTIRVIFSEDIDGSTLNADSFQVSAGDGAGIGATSDNNAPVEGSYVYDAATAMATFTPTHPFPTGKTVVVILSSGITDKAGNGLVDHAFYFTVASLPIINVGDVTPPTVVSSTPAQNANNVISGIMKIQFSEAIDPSTLNHDTVHIYSVGDASISLGGEITEFGFVNSGSPDTLLLASMEVTQLTASKVVVLLTTGVKDMAGNALAADYTLEFHTE